MAKKKKSNAGLMAGVVILALLVLVLGGSYIWFVNQLRPVSSLFQAKNFTVEEGETNDSIYQRLQDEGLIRSAFCTKVYVKISELGNIKAGTFELNQSWSTRDVLVYLNDENNAVPHPTARVTLTPGDWAKDMARKLGESLDVSSEELLELWNDSSYISTLAEDYWFITPEIFNSQRVLLEGYLAPDTYEFYVDSSADFITRRLLDQTKQVLDPYRSQIESSELGVHGLITMASIIQYEGSNEENMRLISSVFYNRMAIGMRLQSSVTVCYGLYEYDSWEDCEANTSMRSDYNTYMVDGLPPGPITNPTPTAIKAALDPAESDYYFFIADVYGDGTIYFSRTYEEHLALVEKYLNQ